MSSINEFKAIVDNTHRQLQANAGHIVTSGSNGPIGIDIIDKLIPVLESIDYCFNDLNQRLKKLEDANK